MSPNVDLHRRTGESICANGFLPLWDYYVTYDKQLSLTLYEFIFAKKVLFHDKGAGEDMFPAGSIPVGISLRNRNRGVIE